MASQAVLKNFLGGKNEKFTEEQPSSDKPLEPGKLVTKGVKFKAEAARFRIVVDAVQGGIEKYYFWVVRMIQTQPPFGLDLRGEPYNTGRVEKVKDIFSATESSSYWGNIEQRKGLQQDKIANYLATIGKMVKDIFQIIRELRIMDERLGYYDGVSKDDKAADYALKGIWIDIVEGGSKNPSSVYGLAMQVGFSTLPDLFFSTFVKKSADVDSAVSSDKLSAFNRKVKEVLARKLMQYTMWKEKTELELRTRKNFVLKYLRQHYNVIRLYMNWLRPYLRNARRLQMHNFDMSDPDLIRSFETAKTELEVLGIKYKYRQPLPSYTSYEEMREFKHYFPVLRVRFFSTTIPMMQMQQEYQRGPVHAGQNIIIMEGYYATQEELDKYKASIVEEDLELLSSLFESMAAMQDELKKYLVEAGETFIGFEEKKQEEEHKQTALDPFKGIFKGFKEMFTSFKGPKAKKSAGAPVQVSDRLKQEEKSAAETTAGQMTYGLYYVFKKAFRMVTE